MGRRVVVVKVHEDLIFLSKTARDKWIRKLLIRYGEIIESEHFINLDL
jgi:hypothetical protein